MTKELEGHGEGLRAEIHIDFHTQNSTKKNIKLENTRPWWNTWILVKEIPLHSRQTSTPNEQMPTRNTRIQMDDQRKDDIDPEGLPQGNRPNDYRLITCLPIMWKILAQIIEEIYYSLTSCWLFPEEQKGYRKVSRGTGELLCIDQHILNERKTRQKNLDWLQKGIWYIPTKLDNKLQENVQNIW